MENIIQIIKSHGIAIVCFLSIFVFAVLLQLFGIIESFQQFVVVLASAAATYIIVQITLTDQNKKQFELQENLNEQQSKLQQKLIEQQNILQKELLENQSKEDNKAKRDLELYNAKLKIYSEFVSSLYESLSDNKIIEDEFINLRTKLLGNVCFYIDNKDILASIKKELDIVKIYTDTDTMARFFAGITSILQEDLKKDRFDTKEDILQISRKFDEISDNTPKFDEISDDTPKKEEQKKIIPSFEKINDAAEHSELISENSKRLKQQAWHFNALGDSQFKQFEELDKEEYELSLVEYGEYWRTNLLRQVGKGDIIMLFRRGGYGYVGAFEAIGRRIFDFEKGKEEILYFDEEKTRPVEDFNDDVEKYDIYKSKEDGASLCSNLIVKCLAYVPDGVGNPGGVYRRTISRYDSHYAWLLKERFQKKGQWVEE